MRVNPISFSGIYKTDRNTVMSSYTNNFIQNNMYPKKDNLVITTSYNDEYSTYYILTKNDKKLEKELENCIKKDYGKYWKSEPLPELWINSRIAEQIFQNDKAIKHGKESWVDYSKDKPECTEEIPF